MRRPSCECPGPEACPRCLDVVSQAEDWLRAHVPPGVSGQGRQGAAFRAAATICVDFGLRGAAAEGVFLRWNEGCQPPLTLPRALAKVRDAEQKAAGNPAGVGKLVFRGGGGGPAPASAPAAGGGDGVDRVDSVDRDFVPAEALRFDRGALVACQVGGLVVDSRWLAERSVVRPHEVTVEAFFEGLYRPGDRILVFNVFSSQGQWVYEVGGSEPWWRVPDGPGGSRVSCGRPGISQRCGMWYLTAPVTGGWKRKLGAKNRDQMTRRSEQNCTRFEYLVLESDEPGVEALWLNFLVQLPLPIVAMYSSGGKSVHALVRVGAANKGEFERVVGVLRPLLVRCGADRVVLSAVRLSRLPGFVRLGSEYGKGDAKRYERFPKPRLQRLLYWNPEAKAEAILGRRRLLAAGI